MVSADFKKQLFLICLQGIIRDNAESKNCGKGALIEHEIAKRALCQYVATIKMLEEVELQLW
jgi:hypothetical protein